MSNQIQINISIDLDLFPKLHNFTDIELSGIIKHLFNKWYDESYNNNISTEQLNVHIDKGMESSINTIQNSINDMNQITKEMYGISKSVKKGQIFETLVQDIIQKHFEDYSYSDTSTIAHSGDGLLISPTGLQAMVEMKNYSSIVNSNQIKKLKIDMKFTGIKYAIMISSNTSIQGKKNFDIEVFIDEGIEYHIVYVSYVFEHEYKIQTGIVMLEHLYSLKKNENINLIQSLQVEINELNLIIDSMSSIKTNFLSMEKTMKDSLDNFYLGFRESESNMKCQIKTIMGMINKKIECINVDSEHVLTFYSSNKECIILKKLYDEIFSKEFLEMNIENSMINLIDMKKSKKIAEIKFIAKRIDIQFFYPDIKLMISNDKIEINKKLLMTIIKDYRLLHDSIIFK